ncbi:MAG: hypothetical protein K8U57_18500 [Planctomycetes bacterium]|nr:hypothetical protein [Planctomycetota bacterium]
MSSLSPKINLLFSDNLTHGKIEFDGIMQCARADSILTQPYRELAAKFRVSRTAMALAKAGLYHSAGTTRYPHDRLPLEIDPGSEALVIPLTGTLRVPRHECIVAPLTATGMYVVPTNGEPPYTIGTGIVQPDDWDQLPGIVVVVQSPLDCLLLWSVGICSVAVPHVGTDLETLLNVIHFYGKEFSDSRLLNFYRKESGDSGLLNDTLKKRGWFWADPAGESLSAWASVNAGAMKNAGLKGVELSWWTTCSVGDWVRESVPSVTCSEHLIEIGDTLAAIVEDNSAESGDMPESPTLSDSPPPKCDTLPLAALETLVPEAPYRKYLSVTARSRHDLEPMERFAAEAAALAEANGDEAEVKHWVRVGEWATRVAAECFDLPVPARPTSGVTDVKESLPYVVSGNQICIESIDANSEVKRTALCNFTAVITSDITRDDGTEKTRTFGVQGCLHGTPLEPIQVSSADFDEMKWPAKEWGAEPNVYAVKSVKDHLRSAIRFLSGRIPRRTIYTHTGWREIGGRWVYLTAGGAIGSTGVVPDVTVDFGDSSLKHYLLPEPSHIADQARYVRASLGLLNGLADDRIMYPLFASIWRAVLGESSTILAINGLTGAKKSQLAALFQQHWGKTMDAQHLPASWQPTANVLERIGHNAKDAGLVVDDFCPPNGHEAAKYHAKADDLLRGAGNGSSRGRMRADTTLRPSKPTRCLIVTTGETSPRGQSLQARMLQLDLVKEMVDEDRLTVCQQDAANGDYAHAMSAFVQWLAPQYAEMKRGLASEIINERDLVAQNGQHGRTRTIVADLLVGLSWFLEFAQTVGAISKEQALSHLERAQNSLADAAVRQTEDQSSEEPTGKFLRLLSAAIAGGNAHVAAPDGSEPDKSGQWGWRDRHPLGTCVGWVDGDDLYLEPALSFGAACDVAESVNDGFHIGVRDLQKRLDSAGLLVGVKAGRQRTARKTLGGKTSRPVLHLKVSSLVANDDQPTQRELDDCYDSLG